MTYQRTGSFKAVSKRKKLKIYLLGGICKNTHPDPSIIVVEITLGHTNRQEFHMDLRGERLLSSLTMTRRTYNYYGYL
jgi:hypothetical protein